MSFTNVFPKRIKFEHNTFWHGRHLNLARYEGMRYAEHYNDFSCQRRHGIKKPRTPPKKKSKPPKVVKIKPPTPSKTPGISEDQKINLRKRMFLEKIKQLAP